MTAFSSLLAKEAAPLLGGAALVTYGVAQALLAAFSLHRCVTLWRLRGRSRRGKTPGDPPAAWPRVTVQLPVFNERRVVERLIAAAAALDYPRDRLEVQVLDDSTDDTCDAVDRAVVRARAAGVAIQVLRRTRRTGFKAGALAEGFDGARGELLAVFDADFVVPPDFLRRMVPHFADPRVGMAQARWGHLNRDRSLLTAAQAAMLDAHFHLEHRARAAQGLFFNFNGTAGVWRRECVRDAGGWSSATLTEDLDLSYRAQLAGWRFVYDDSVEVRGELPSDMAAFRIQQHRWVKGSIQTARRILPALLRAPLPVSVRLEAFVHLAGNAAYPLLMVLTVCLVPAMVAVSRTLPLSLQLFEYLLLALGLLPVTLFLVAGQRGQGRGAWRTLRDVAAALLVGAGLAPSNTRAWFEGLGPGVGEWVRTPKTGEGGLRGRGPLYRPRVRGRGLAELTLAAGLGVLAAWAWHAGMIRPLPHLLLMFSGFAYVGARSLGIGAAPLSES